VAGQPNCRQFRGDSPFAQEPLELLLYVIVGDPFPYAPQICVNIAPVNSSGPSISFCLHLLIAGIDSPPKTLPKSQPEKRNLRC